MIEVTDEDVQAVEAIVGMGSAAWDCVDPKKIIAAAWEVMRKRKALLFNKVTITNGLKDGPSREWREQMSQVEDSACSVGVRDADECGVCGCGFRLPSGRCDHCDTVSLESHGDTLAEAVKEAMQQTFGANMVVEFCELLGNECVVEAVNKKTKSSARRFVSLDDNFPALAAAAVSDLARQVRQ